MRSSLLKRLAILSCCQTIIVPQIATLCHRRSSSLTATAWTLECSARLRAPDRVFDLLRQRLVVVAAQPQRRAEGDAHPARAAPSATCGAAPCRGPRAAPARPARRAATRSCRCPAGTGRSRRSSVRRPSGKISTEKPSLEHLADVAQRLPRAGLALRQRERVEEERRQVVVQAVGEPRPPAVLLREEVRLEELLRHRRRERGSAGAAAAPPGSPACPCGSDGSRRR